MLNTTVNTLLGNAHIFASDFDETITTSGAYPSSDVLTAFARLRSLSLSVALVTGRILDDLFNVFPDVFEHVDVVVAENGAVVANNSKHLLLGPPVNQELIARLEAQNLHFLTGQAIVCCWRHDLAVVASALRDLEHAYDLLLNKEALMIAPKGLCKRTGLVSAIEIFLVNQHRTARDELVVVGVGDAENDQSLFDASTITAAVLNSVPELKANADIVLTQAAGDGVVELASMIIEAPSRVINLSRADDQLMRNTTFPA